MPVQLLLFGQINLENDPGTAEFGAVTKVAFPEPSLLAFENARLQARATPVPTTLADGQRPSRRVGNMLEPYAK